MVNRDNTIEGRHIDRHPLQGQESPFPLALVSRSMPMLAARAERPGILETTDGPRPFQAGDWILTDYPPTYAIMVRAMVFDQDYVKVMEIPDGVIPTGPVVVANADPKPSIPPSNRAAEGDKGQQRGRRRGKVLEPPKT